MRVIVCGGRDYGEKSPDKRIDPREDSDRWLPEVQHVVNVLRDLAERHGRLVVVQGGGPGAARTAREWAKRHRHGLETFEPEPAGPGLPAWAALKKRSREMVEAGADLAVFFPGGDGTRHEFEMVVEAGIPFRDERAKDAWGNERTGRPEGHGG